MIDVRSFAKIDPNGYWTLTEKRAEIAGAPSTDTTSCVYKDFGAGHFRNYLHFVDAKLLSPSTHNTGVGIWAVSNAVGGYSEILGYSHMLYIKRNAVPSSDYLYLRDYTGGFTTSTFFTMQQTVYVRVQRNGAVLTAKMYSTAKDRDLNSDSNLIGSELSTYCGETAFRYLIAGFGGQGHSPYNVSGWAENFNINEPPMPSFKIP